MSVWQRKVSSASYLSSLSNSDREFFLQSEINGLINANPDSIQVVEMLDGGTVYVNIYYTENLI